jgi:hypothetical protein
VTALDLTMNNLGQRTGDDLALAFAAIPPGVTTLNLSRNGLDQKTGAELAAILASIPPHVKEINLQGNNLFKDKSPEAIDDLLLALDGQRSRLDLRGNEEAAFARAAGPLSQMTHGTLFPHARHVDTRVAGRIASFLGANEAEAGQRILSLNEKRSKQEKPAPDTGAAAASSGNSETQAKSANAASSDADGDLKHFDEKPKGPKA